MDLVMLAGLFTFVSFVFGAYLAITRNLIFLGNEQIAKALHHAKQIPEFELDVQEFAKNEFETTIQIAQEVVYTTGIIYVVQLINTVWVLYTMLNGASPTLNTIAAFLNALMVPIWRKTQNDIKAVEVNTTSALLLLSAAITYQETEKQNAANTETHQNGSPISGRTVGDSSIGDQSNSRD